MIECPRTLCLMELSTTDGVRAHFQWGPGMSEYEADRVLAELQPDDE